MNRREFLRLSGVGVAGAALAGLSTPGRAQGRQIDTRSSLQDEFESAAREYAVPAELLSAMGYVNTRWEMPPANANVYEKGNVHGWGSYGIMGLVQNPFSDTLAEAAALTGISEKVLKTDRAANIRGGAALLGEAMGFADGPALADYFGAIRGNGRAPARNFESVAGVGAGDLYAEQVFQTLEDGVPESATTSGERMSLASRDTGASYGLSGGGSGSYELSGRRNPEPSEVWYPAHRANYTRANRHAPAIDKIVVHCTQGSWASAIRWFQDRRAQVSAHYVIRSRDGKIAQCVSDLNIAWHAGDWAWNRASIGIEHEGYFGQRRWFTRRMINRSANLAAYLCRKYNIRPNARNIVGHRRCSSTNCPSGAFPYRLYIRRVRHYYRRRG